MGGDLTCTEGPDYKGCPVPPAPPPPPPCPPPPPFWTQRTQVKNGGGNLKILRSVENIEVCFAACEADAECHSVDYGLLNANCYLQTNCVTAEQAGMDSDYVTFYKPCCGPEDQAV